MEPRQGVVGESGKQWMQVTGRAGEVIQYRQRELRLNEQLVGQRP